MRTIMAKSPHDSSFSFSRRYFHWKKNAGDFDHDVENEEEILNTISSFSCEEEKQEELIQMPKKKKKSLSKFKSVLTIFTRTPSLYPSGLGTKVVGTLFGHRRGHVHFAFQENPKLNPAFLIELATPTSVLIREMASGLVRIALECEKKIEGTKSNTVRLLEEPLWRTYCNGRKCGYGNRRECGAEEWKILKAVEPISMGAGVLPPASGNGGGGSYGELMYMRAKFERVVGSRDSEAFYMMNPDGSGGPELSIYLLRV